MPTETVDTELVQAEIKNEIGDAIDVARTLAAAIKDDDSRSEAAKFGSTIQSKIVRVKAKKEELVPPLRRAYENVLHFFDDALRPLEAAKKALAQAVSSYDIEVERKRRLEQEAREAEARRQQEEYERKKREYEAAQAEARAEAERVKKAQEAEAKRLQEERDRKIKEEESARLAHAQEATNQGNVAKVGSILDKTQAIAPTPIIESPNWTEKLPILPPPPPPSLAIAAPIVVKRPDPSTLSKDIWKAEGVDIIALAQAVVEHRAPKEYLQFNMVEINRDLRKLKDEFKLPGVRAWKERSTTFRANDE